MWHSLCFEVFNEPHRDVPIDQLLAYYQHVYDVIRANCHLGVPVIFRDAFRPYEMAELFSQLGMQNITLDVHLYQLFKTANVGWTYWTARTEDQGVWSFLDHPKFIEGIETK